MSTSTIFRKEAVRVDHFELASVPRVAVYLRSCAGARGAHRSADAAHAAAKDELVYSQLYSTQYYYLLLAGEIRATDRCHMAKTI